VVLPIRHKAKLNAKKDRQIAIQNVEVVCSICLEILSFAVLAVAFRRVDLQSFKPIFLTLIRQKATRRGPHHYPITSLLSIEFSKFLFNMKTSSKLENILQIFFKTSIAHRYGSFTSELCC
jgi:hypothetical protein